MKIEGCTFIRISSLFLIMIFVLCTIVWFPRDYENVGRSFIQFDMSNAYLNQDNKLLNGWSLPRVVWHDPQICGKEQLDWIFIATSAPENYNRRMLLRRTYANVTLFKTMRFKLIIVVGMTGNASIDTDVYREFRQHRDIVVGDFKDAFWTLSLKMIFGLKWISKYCNKAPFIIKIDDDAFVNIFEILNLIEPHSKKSNFMMCAVLDNNFIFRWKHHSKEYCKQIKVCVDDGILPGYKNYPRYCNGQMFVFPNDLLQRLVDAIDNTTYFWLDDVYITGMITKNLSIEYINIQMAYAWPHQIAAQYRVKTAPTSYYFAHVKNQTLFGELWNLLLGKLPAKYREKIYYKQ